VYARVKARAVIRERQNGAFVQGLALKTFTEKYFVRKSHKIKHEMCVDRLASTISREISWRVIKKIDEQNNNIIFDMSCMQRQR
jgi:hypothetical protein